MAEPKLANPTFPFVLLFQTASRYRRNQPVHGSRGAHPRGVGRARRQRSASVRVTHRAYPVRDHWWLRGGRPRRAAWLDALHATPLPRPQSATRTWPASACRTGGIEPGRRAALQRPRREDRPQGNRPGPTSDRVSCRGWSSEWSSPDAPARSWETAWRPRHQRRETDRILPSTLRLADPEPAPRRGRVRGSRRTGGGCCR